MATNFGRVEIQRIDHVQNAIPVGEEDAARAFYGGLLGLTEVPKPAALAGRGGCWFEQGDVQVHIGVEADFRAARKAHVAFVVDDVASLNATARAAGYEVKDDDPLDGVERIFVFDPFGNRLEFQQPLR
jgi:catechol 2,3-dioxygenase-like lactoylglutathione lyase family enzyme